MPQCIVGTFQHHDAITFTNLHALAIRGKRRGQEFANEAQAVEPRIGIFAHGVVAAAQRQIDLSCAKQRDPQGDAAQS